MQLSQEELRAHLMDTSEEFRRLAQQHCEYKKRLEALSSQPYLTSEEQMEEVRIKKLKLHSKDQMQQMMDRQRLKQPA